MGAKSDDSEQLFNRNLTALIAVIFLFYGGLSCLYSTLVPHLIELGFRSIEISYLLTIVALISIIGPLIFAPLIDLIADRRKAQFGRFLQFILALLLILGAIAYGMLLLVPAVRRTPSQEPSVTFGCDSSGALVFQKRCSEEKNCYHWDGEKLGSLTLENCSYTCQTPEKFENLYHEWVREQKPNEPIEPVAQSIIDASTSESSLDYESRYKTLLYSYTWIFIRLIYPYLFNTEKPNNWTNQHSRDDVDVKLNHRKLSRHTFVLKKWVWTIQCTLINV